MAQFQYAIVKFPDEEDSRGIIPLSWIDENEEGWCYYPRASSDEVLNYLIRSRASPAEGWEKHKMCVLKCFETYSDARVRLKEADLTSNLESDEEILCNRPRKRKINTRLVYPGEGSYGEESEEDQPTRKVASKSPYPVFRAKQNSPTVSSPLALGTPGQKSTQSQVDTPWETPIKDDKLLRAVLEVKMGLADVLQKQQELEAKFDVILARMNQPQNENCQENTSGNQDPDVAFLTMLPFRRMEEFTAFEDKLKETPSMRTKFSKLLMSVGGADVKFFSINAMRRALTDELAQGFSFTGKKGFREEKKLAFASTQLFLAIQYAARKVLRESFCEANLKKHVTIWLNQAKTRLTRRSERKALQEVPSSNRDEDLDSVELQSPQ